MEEVSDDFGIFSDGTGVLKSSSGDENHSNFSNLGLTIIVGVSVVAISYGVSKIIGRFRASGK